MSSTSSNPETFPEKAALDAMTRIRCHRPHVCENPDDDCEPTPSTCPNCHDRVFAMSAIFLETCPEDWTGVWGRKAGDILLAVVRGHKNPDDHADAARMMSFRWKAVKLADKIVELLGLPAPNNKTCMVWVESEWRRQNDGIPGFGTAYREIFRYLQRALAPSPEQGPPFDKFSYYLAAATMEASFSKEEACAIIEMVVQEIRKAKSADPELSYQREDYD